MTVIVRLLSGRVRQSAEGRDSIIIPSPLEGEGEGEGEHL